MKPASPLTAPRLSSRFVTGFGSFLLFADLCGALTPGLNAAGSTPPSTTTNSPVEARPLRLFNETDLLALLTATLQRDEVKDRGELELTFQQPWAALSLSNEPITLKVLEAPASGVAPSFIVRFQLCTASETLGTWQAAVQAHVWRTVWVAHSNLRRGLVVHEADIVRERFDVLKVREALADFSPADDSHLELAEAVSSGVPLLARMIKLQAVIHRGQVANALIQDGALSITAKVEALEDGAPGQVIHARNPISRHDLSGRVLDNQTILVSL